MGEVKHPIEEEKEEEEEEEEKEERKEEGETLVCPSLSTQSKLCFPCCTRTGG